MVFVPVNVGFLIVIVGDGTVVDIGGDGVEIIGGVHGIGKSFRLETVFALVVDVVHV
jgi:hypothetical protein